MKKLLHLVLTLSLIFTMVGTAVAAPVTDNGDVDSYTGFDHDEHMTEVLLKTKTGTEETRPTVRVSPGDSVEILLTTPSGGVVNIIKGPKI
jgi:hypothetical protein